MTSPNVTGVNVAALMAQGLNAHQCGDLATAAALYRQVLNRAPRHADALHLSGVLAHQAGDHQQAAALIGQAVAINGKNAAYQANLGLALQALGQLDAAGAALSRAVKLDGKYVEARHNLAMLRKAEGRLAQAESDLRAAIRLNGDFVESHRQLGLMLQEQGRAAESLPHLQRVVALSPRDAGALNNLSVALRQLGRHGEAIAYQQAALNEAPRDAAMLGNLAGAFFAAGDLAQAAETYVQALALDDRNAALLNNFALTLQGLGQWDDAAACFDAAIAADPAYAAPRDNLGTLLTLRGQPAAAVPHHAAAVGLNRLHANGWNNLGNALAASGRKAQAPPCWRNALAINPTLAEGWTNLGVGLRDMEDFAAAARVLSRALALDHRVAAAWNNRGDALQLTAGDGVALFHYRRAVALEPAYAEAWSNIALATQRGGDPGSARRLFDRALTLNPELAGARFNRGLLRLEGGDLPGGWPDYAYRFASGKVGRARAPAMPAWRGESLAAGQKLLVWREQGLGDEILFASLYADLLAHVSAQGVAAVFECDRRLVGLLSRAAPAGAVFRPQTIDVDGRETLSPPDCARHAPAGSLARLLRRELRDFSPRGPWLAADPTRVAAWRDRLAAPPATGGKLRVGIAWRSQLMTAERRAAYLQLTDFAPLFALSGIEWVNVQYGETETELRAAEAQCGVVIRRWDDLDLKDDLEGLAALMVNLDLVIAPAVSAGEMAAGLGVPVWRLGGRDWTWLGSGARPWFPTVQVFAPAAGEGLADLLTRAAHRLTGLAASVGPLVAALPDPRVLVNMATGHLQQGRAAAAGQAARAALCLDPALAAALSGLGAAWRADGAAGRAESWQRRALRASPGHPAALVNLGRARAAAGDWPMAARVLRIAVAAAPEQAAAYANLGHVLRFQGDAAAAERAADRALRLDPALRTAQANRALLRLARGDLPGGWDDYGARLRPPTPTPDARSLAEKTVEIQGEQGLGDEILFAACLNDLTSLTGRLRLTCDRRLVSLFARSFPAVAVRPTGTPEPEPADLIISAGDSPRFLRRSPADFPPPAGPLLQADPARVARWRRVLAAAGPGLKIGVAWTSGLIMAERLACRTRLADWRGLAQVPGVTLVNLQYGAAADEIAAAETAWEQTILRWPGLDLRDDLEETAALCAALDLVITVPTAVGELAAAVGTPSWRLTTPGDWTLLGTAVRPWFPAQRVITPPPGGGMAQAIEKASRFLASRFLMAG